MFTLILTIWLGPTTSSTSVPNFQTFALCEAAAIAHKASVVTASGGGKEHGRYVIATCAKTQEK